MRGFWVAVLVCLPITHAGCGSDSDDSSAIPSPTTSKAFFAAYFEVICDRIGPCCQADDLPHDAAICKDLAPFEGEVLSDLLGITEKVEYDANGGKACLAGLAAKLAGCGSKVSYDCTNVFHGTVAAGETCASAAECAADAGYDASCVYGICEVVEHGALGVACDYSCTGDVFVGICTGGISENEARCYEREGLFCGQSDTCEPLVELGASGCTGTPSCVAGAFCQVDTCVPTCAVGESCSNERECDAKTAYCDGVVCTAKLALGESCYDDRECLANNCKEQICASAFADFCSG